MSKINFLKDNKNSDSGGDPSGEKEAGGAADIAWTSPEKITPAVDGGHAPADNMFGTIAKIKNRLNYVDRRNSGTVNPVSGDAIFTVEKSDPEAPSNNNGQNVKKTGFWGKFFNSKNSDGQNIIRQDLKNKKAMIASYGDVFNNEKKIRKNINGNTDPDNSASLIDMQAEKSRPEIEKNAELSGQDKWKAPKILKTDLIKDEVTVFIDWNKNIKNILSNLAMAAIIIGMVYVGLELWGKSSAEQVKSLNNEIEILAKNIIKTKEDIKEIDNFQKKLNIANTIIEKHIYWTNFFDFLEKNTLPNINFTGGFRGDSSGKYNFEAVAPSYNDLTDQVRVFKSDTGNVLNVDVSKGSLAGGTANDQPGGKNIQTTNVEFNMLLDVNPKIFLK